MYNQCVHRMERKRHWFRIKFKQQYVVKQFQMKKHEIIKLRLTLKYSFRS